MGFSMWQLVKDLFRLLNKRQKKEFYKLQALVLVMSFAEIVGIASILPLIVLISDPSILQENAFLFFLFQQSGVSSPQNFVFIVGVLSLALLVFSSIISIFTTWKIAIYTNNLGSEMADRLFKYYIYQDWLFYTTGSISKLTKHISVETLRVTSMVLQPLMLMNAKLVFAFILSLFLILYDPIVSITGIAFFFLSYVLLFYVVKEKLNKNGKEISSSQEDRFEIMNTSFRGVKNLILTGERKNFVNNFRESGNKLAYSQGTNVALGFAPRYFMEMIAFGSMISLILYLDGGEQNKLIMPILAMYALVALKLLPAFQQVYANLAQIKGHISAFESIKEDLTSASLKIYENNKGDLNCKKLYKSICLNNVSFKYPQKENTVLNDINIEILKGEMVGFVGSSGSGKSTVVDMIMGFFTPASGSFLVDGKILSNTCLECWKKSIGYVPQDIHLGSGTIAENIAFGMDIKEINRNQINDVLKITKLESVINTLPDGIDTSIGEDGIQLSGGQRQRIGIARALYRNPDVLVFDEATSALDGITEDEIMKSIEGLHGKKTIIMIAHRLKTVEKCDTIFLMDNGKIIDKGGFEELKQRNKSFMKMSKFS